MKSMDFQAKKQTQCKYRIQVIIFPVEDTFCVTPDRLMVLYMVVNKNRFYFLEVSLLILQALYCSAQQQQKCLTSYSHKIIVITGALNSDSNNMQLQQE